VAFQPILWARQADRLWNLEKSLRAIIEAQAKEIEALKDRVTKLEAREEILIARTQAASAAAATASTNDLARRIGALEERTRSQGRLPPPED
jgi:hypothetical protein